MIILLFMRKNLLALALVLFLNINCHSISKEVWHKKLANDCFGIAYDELHARILISCRAISQARYRQADIENDQAFLDEIKTNRNSFIAALDIDGNEFKNYKISGFVRPNKISIAKDKLIVSDADSIKVISIKEFPKLERNIELKSNLIDKAIMDKNGIIYTIGGLITSNVGRVEKDEENEKDINIVADDIFILNGDAYSTNKTLSALPNNLINPTIKNSNFKIKSVNSANAGTLHDAIGYENAIYAVNEYGDIYKKKNEENKFNKIISSNCKMISQMAIAKGFLFFNCYEPDETLAPATYIYKYKL